MPRFLVPGLARSGRVRLPDEESRHLVRVLRARPGDPVRLFDGLGREVECVVVDAGRDDAVVEIAREIEVVRPGREVTLCTSIPRGERMEWLVEKAVEAGVARIVPIAADRSVRKDAGPNSIRRWGRAAAEAAKQCGRADVPAVDEPVSLADAISRTAGSQRVVATPGSPLRLPDALVPQFPAAIFIGPEGGFEPVETSLLAGAGARPFGLGPHILRVETAAVVAVHAAANS